MNLREQQLQLTRQRILDAFGGGVRIHDFHQLSHAEVARRAGVSERTVWRHFPTRRALGDAYIQRMAERLGWSPPTSLDEMPEWAAALFTAIHQRIPLEPVEEPEALTQNRAARFAHLLSLVEPATPELASEEARAAAAVLQVLIRPDTLEFWRRNWSLDEAQVSAGVSWALRVLIADLRNHGGPRCSSSLSSTQS